MNMPLHLHTFDLTDKWHTFPENLPVSSEAAVVVGKPNTKSGCTIFYCITVFRTLCTTVKISLYQRNVICI